jgi:hypothetical protein
LKEQSWQVTEASMFRVALLAIFTVQPAQVEGITDDQLLLDMML